MSGVLKNKYIPIIFINKSSFPPYMIPTIYGDVISDKQAMEKEFDDYELPGYDKRSLQEIKKKLKNKDYNDLEQIKSLANTEGIPYQTLISSILHKYINDRFVDKKEVFKISELLKSQHSRLDQMEKDFKNRLNYELKNSTKQIESFIGIQTYLTRDQLIPEMHGWPVSPE